MSEPVQDTPATTPDPAPAATPKKSDEVPEWARKQISDANQEAANYRVQLRETETARKALEEQVATLSAHKAEAETGRTTVQSDFDRLVTAIQAEVPLDKVFAFAKTLKGDTAEELAAHAAELKDMFNLPSAPSPAVDRSQGLGSDSAKPDPASVFASFIQSSLSR